MDDVRKAAATPALGGRFSTRRGCSYRARRRARGRRAWRTWLQGLVGALALTCVGYAYLSPLQVLSHQKISATQGGFSGILESGGRFGVTLASLGDLDGDGVGDLAVGKEADSDGGANRGAIYVLFLNPDGTVRSQQKISSTQGGFAGGLDDGDRFGASATSLGNLDGTGTSQLALAVGAIFDDDGGSSPDADRGAVWILFLNADGTVAAQRKISSTAGGFAGALADRDWFGVSVSSLGDLDGLGPSVQTLAVGALFDDDGGSSPDADRGAVWILFLNADGTVAAQSKISDTAGGFSGALDDGDRFGRKVASLGDLDGDGVADLAVGAPGDDDGGSAPSANRGAVWILFLNPDGSVRSHQKISMLAGGFAGALDDGDLFGRSVRFLGDANGDGTAELAVGASGDDDGGAGRGAVWILSVDGAGTVKGHQKISDTSGGFAGNLDDVDALGVSIASLEDQSGRLDAIAVGAIGDDDGTADAGAVWLMFLGQPPATYCTPKVNSDGCPPRIGFSGVPSASAGSGFLIDATDLVAGTNGLLFYSKAGSNNLPFQGGFLCVLPPTTRTALQSSGGAGPCGGSFSFDFNAWIQSGADPGLVAGAAFWCQYWSRDPASPSTTSLTDALCGTIGL